MKIGDLVRYTGNVGIVLRKLQYENEKDARENWDGDPAWWVQFIGDRRPFWSYEHELTLVAKGN